ncbi:MAG TPA: hypothetical protein VKW77_10930 [Acidimicrobiales bacterium]|nr:hypothetical protein [Acidimicrobiales bacterium]
MSQEPTTDRGIPDTTAVRAVAPLRPGEGSPEPAAALTIDCGECAHQHTNTCDDCVVTFLVGRGPDDAVVVDAEEARAVRMLERVGLVPGLRHARQVS